MKIVYTNGVFDILHIGHINILKKAKSLGDYLVVGIQSDKYVMKRKSKPVLSTKERIKQLKSLGIADEVISYSNKNTTQSLLNKIKPNVFVHGEDWEAQGNREKIKSFMKKKNIELVLFPRTNGISSSHIRNRIIKNLDSQNI